jgi:hypothetical protein
MELGPVHPENLLGPIFGNNPIQIIHPPALVFYQIRIVDKRLNDFFIVLFLVLEVTH